MGIFDALANVCVNTTSAVYGYTATWRAYTAEVKYRDISGDAKLGEVKFGIDNWKIEIRDSDFPGLKTSINQSNKEPITVSVRGVDLQFLGIVANPKSDGMLTEIKLRLKP